MSRLLTYKYFGEYTIRVEDDDEIARREFENMMTLVEYTDIRMFELCLLHTSKMSPTNVFNDTQRVQNMRTILTHALEVISPCVTGWPEGEMPAWAERLNEVVPEIQRALGIESITNGE